MNDKQLLLNWCAHILWTHSATINIQPQYKAVFVCRQFIRNFNRAIFGRDNPMRTLLFPLLVLPVFADDSKVKHIHFAFGGFPQDMSLSQIERAFLKAAKQTKGVMFQYQFKGSSVKLPMVKIEKDPTPEKWLDYILRFSKGIQDKHIMLDQAYFG